MSSNPQGRSSSVKNTEWFPDDEELLITSRRQHPDLTWEKFYQLGLFPGRSQRAVAQRWRIITHRRNNLSTRTYTDIGRQDSTQTGEASTEGPLPQAPATALVTAPCQGPATVDPDQPNNLPIHPVPQPQPSHIQNSFITSIYSQGWRPEAVDPQQAQAAARAHAPVDAPANAPANAQAHRQDHPQGPAQAHASARAEAQTRPSIHALLNNLQPETPALPPIQYPNAPHPPSFPGPSRAGIPQSAAASASSSRPTEFEPTSSSMAGDNLAELATLEEQQRNLEQTIMDNYAHFTPEQRQEMGMAIDRITQAMVAVADRLWVGRGIKVDLEAIHARMVTLSEVLADTGGPAHHDHLPRGI